MTKDSTTFLSRRLAIVLLDIIGSTSIVGKLGAVKAAKFFQIHDNLARSIAYRFNGREIDRSDGFLLSFDRLIDAVNFGLSYQLTVPKKLGINTRIGVHWGDVVEVKQKDTWVSLGAKSVELEGINKNIAARTMSLCKAGQVLLTEEAHKMCRNRTNLSTPKNARYAYVGSYKFKGIKKPQKIFAVGCSLESLQPPEGNEKAKKVDGPSKIKSRLKDMNTQELLLYGIKWIGVVSILVWIFVIYELLCCSFGRDLLNTQDFTLVEKLNTYIYQFLEYLKE